MSIRMFGLALAASLLLAGTAAAEKIKIGVTPGPHAQILEVVKPIAAKKGLDLDILEFSDYVVPNAALHAVAMLAGSDAAVAEKLAAFRARQTEAARAMKLPDA